MRHSRGQADATARWRQCHQPRHAQCELVAALGAGERMHFIHHHAGQVGKHHWRIGQCQQHRETLRRGQQDVRRFGTLASAAIGGGVAGACLDRYRQPHVLHRAREVACDVGSQCLQRADVQRVDTGARCLSQRDQGRQEAGQRLAAAGGRDQQHAVAGARGIKHRELMPPRRPALVSEPGGKRFWQCSNHGGVLLGLAADGKRCHMSRHGASFDLAAGPAAGAVLRTGRLLHRSDPGGGSRGHYPRTFGSCATGTPRSAGESQHAGADASTAGRRPRRRDPASPALGRED